MFMPRTWSMLDISSEFFCSSISDVLLDLQKRIKDFFISLFLSQETSTDENR
jgi:hypothetical protein